MTAAGLSGAGAPGAHDGEGSPSAEEPQVLFSVTKGNPTPEELAALTAVIAAASAAEPEEEDARTAPTRRERIRQATLRPRHVISQRRGRL